MEVVPKLFLAGNKQSLDGEGGGLLIKALRTWRCKAYSLNL